MSKLMLEELKTIVTADKRKMKFIMETFARMEDGEDVEQILSGLNEADALLLMKFISTTTQILEESNKGNSEMKKMNSTVQSMSNECHKTLQGKPVDQSKLAQYQKDIAAINQKTIKTCIIPNLEEFAGKDSV